MAENRLLYLSQADVVATGLSMAEILEALETAFRAKGEGRTEMPPKPGVHPGGGNNFIHAMPAYIQDLQSAGVKWVSGFPENYQRGLPYITGLLIYNDVATGLPLAVMDCVWITAKRTGAASVIAARRLARPESAVLGMLGCGVQGRSHAEAFRVLFPLKKILAYDQDPAAARRYAEEIGTRLSIEVVPVKTPREAVSGCDIVVTAGPILKTPHATIQTGWLEAGAFASLVDYDSYWSREALAQADKFCTDDVPQLRLYQSMGYFQNIPPIHADLGELATGKKKGRETPLERTMTANLGLAIDDMAVAPLLYRRAREKGIGTWLPLWNRDKDPMNTDRTYDVIITGGGIMGSSTAYYLSRMAPGLKIAVVERDPSYARASTTLSMSNVRIQFSLKENILISQYAVQILDAFEEEMAVEDRRPRIYFHRDGNLFLVGEQNRQAARRAYDLQISLGCRVQWWSPEQIQARYPLYDTSGIVGGTFGPDDGHFDAYAALMAYKAKARSQGVRYLAGEVVRIRAGGGRAEGVDLGSGETLSAGCVVNCGGAWAAQIAETAGVKLPVIPVKRQVFALDPAVKPEGPLPLTVLLSGLYFRTETGGLILLGKSMEEDPVGFNFTWDDQRFMEILWPELAEFVPAWDRLKLVRGWAGLYDVNTLDHNAIIGEWPEIGGLYFATGFSGHGLQQGPAVGRYLAELILKQALSLDLSIFDPRRVLENRPLSEAGIV